MKYHPSHPIVAVGALGVLVASLWCFLRGRHGRPQRQRIGGFRCEACGHAAADLDGLGYYGDGYVSPVRRTFSRKGGAVERTSGFQHYEQPKRPH